MKVSKYRETRRKYRDKNKEKLKNYHKKWISENPEWRIKQYQKKYFNGLTDKVYERDNWTCQECGMTQEQHIIIFNRQLTIHHIDGNGVYSKKQNNDIENLITLCLRCHGKKHGRISKKAQGGENG